MEEGLRATNCGESGAGDLEPELLVGRAEALALVELEIEKVRKKHQTALYSLGVAEDPIEV